MSDPDWTRVRYIDGPHDGRETDLPAPMVYDGARAPLPSPHAVQNMPAADAPTIYSGPADEYIIERRGNDWVAVYRPS